MLEYTVCGKKYYCNRYVEIPIKNVENKNIRRIFKLFQQLLPNHPTQENTKIVLLEREKQTDMLFICTHFEHGSQNHLAKIQVIMDELAYFSKYGATYLELLDTIGECLIIIVYDIDKRTLKKVAKEA